MEKIILILIILTLPRCAVQKEKQGIKWIESQVLCVYWPSSFERRDTLSAINFTIESTSSDILKATEYSFEAGKRKYTLKKTVLIDKGRYFLQGLKLECRSLFEFTKITK
jgi:hypothetical protein